MFACGKGCERRVAVRADWYIGVGLPGDDGAFRLSCARGGEERGGRGCGEGGGEFSEALFEAGALEEDAVCGAPAEGEEGVCEVARETGGVEVSRAGDVAGFANAAPGAADRLVLGAAGEFHLEHGAAFTEDLAAFSAVDDAVDCA